MATLEIVFLGLIAFAPDSTGKQLWALMPETGKKKNIPCVTGFKVLDFPEHDKKGLAIPTTITPTLSPANCLRVTLVGSHNVYDVTGYEVRLAPPSLAAPLAYAPRTTANLSYPLDPTDAKAFDWTARIADVVPDLAYVSSGCLKTPVTQCSLSARVVLDRGTVSTECLVLRDPMASCDKHWQHPHKIPSRRTFRFATSLRDNSLGEGTKVLMESLADGTSVKFTAKKLDGSGSACTLMFSLPAGGTRLAFMHQAKAFEPDALCQSGGGSHSHKAFRYFYGLSEKAQGTLTCSSFPTTLFPLERCRGGSSPRCPQATFEVP